MKSNCTFSTLKNFVLFFVIMLITVRGQAQAPIYKFKNPALISGTGGQVGAIYRFPNVNTSGTNIDGLVEIKSKVGSITLQNIDRTADGYDEAFQPEYRIGAATNAYFDFLVTFVLAGTNTPAPQALVDLSALDIDGSSAGPVNLKEFNRIDMGGGICTFNALGSQLTLSQIGTAFDGSNFTGVLFGALVDTAAKEVMFSVSNANVTSFTYRAGSNSLLSGSSTRYASLYFKKFNYPDLAVLSAKNLSSFSGVAADNKTKLKWSLTDGNNASRIILEKSFTGYSFQPFAEFWVNMDGNTQKEFSYTDSKNGEGAVYYRLKIIGADSKVQYSNILHFRSEKNEVNQLAVYPSLVQSATTINYTSNERQQATILVTDMSGRTVKQQPVLLQEGTNSIQVAGFDQFQKGNYIISVATARERAAKQIIVQ